jgi:hypothetical protein
MANVGQAAALSALQWMDALFAHGTITFYSGTMPATPETALVGNTALVTWAFQSTPFSIPSFSGGTQTAAASFVAASVAPVAGGNVTFARAAPATWAANTAYAVGNGVLNGANIYQCMVAGTSGSSGGPTGNAPLVTDGGVTWNFVGIGPALIDYTVGLSSADIIVGNTNIQTGTNVSLALNHKMAAV